MHQFCLGGEGRVIRGGGAQKKKSPDFRSSEVGISVTVQSNLHLQTPPIGGNLSLGDTWSCS